MAVAKGNSGNRRVAIVWNRLRVSYLGHKTWPGLPKLPQLRQSTQRHKEIFLLRQLQKNYALVSGGKKT